VFTEVGDKSGGKVCGVDSKDVMTNSADYALVFHPDLIAGCSKKFSN
jgi:hypothetical protein